MDAKCICLEMTLHSKMVVVMEVVVVDSCKDSKIVTKYICS